MGRDITSKGKSTCQWLGTGGRSVTGWGTDCRERRAVLRRWAGTTEPSGQIRGLASFTSEQGRVDVKQWERHRLPVCILGVHSNCNLAQRWFSKCRDQWAVGRGVRVVLCGLKCVQGCAALAVWRGGGVWVLHLCARRSGPPHPRLAAAGTQDPTWSLV